jgi:uncharacterized protein with von Willebrand factor type A (vWA) domain
MPKIPMKLCKQSLAQDSYDHQAWSEVFEAAPAIQQLVEKGEQNLPTFSSLAQDLFASFYKGAPSLNPIEEMKASHRVNHCLMSELMSTRSWQNLRDSTTMDAFGSVLALKTIAPSVLKSIPWDTQQQINDLAQAEEQLQKLLDSRKQQAEQQVEQLTQQVEQAIEQQADQLRQQFRKACDQAEQEIEKVEHALSAFGVEKGDGAPSLNLEQKLEFAERLKRTPKLQKIAELAGRFTRIALKGKKSKTDEPIEPYTLTLGNDLAHVLPSELALLARPTTKREFQRRYVEGQLLQYQLQDKVLLGKGPIIMCIDESGSMMGARETWAKAVFLALMAVARKQKRDIGIIHFGSYHECRVKMFPKGKASLQEVLDEAIFFFNGGTNFDRPLLQAMKITELAMPKADIVFVTDGECQIGNQVLDQWKEHQAKLETKCIGVMIGEAIDSLTRFCGSIISLQKMHESSRVLEEVLLTVHE